MKYCESFSHHMRNVFPPYTADHKKLRFNKHEDFADNNPALQPCGLCQTALREQPELVKHWEGKL